METPQYLSDFKCVLYFQNKLSAAIFLFHSKLLKSLINQMNLDQFGGKILFFLYVLLNESLPVKRYYVIQANVFSCQLDTCATAGQRRYFLRASFSLIIVFDTCVIWTCRKEQIKRFLSKCWYTDFEQFWNHWTILYRSVNYRIQ